MYRLIPLFLLLLLFSCSDKYKVFENKYSFKSKDGTPDYAGLDYWAAHPWKWDPSDSISKPLRGEPRDSIADVFFLHPTSYTNGDKDNAPIDDEYINAKTDYSSILYQASVFNQHCRVFAPRYRQVNLKVFFAKDDSLQAHAFDIAYSDIKKAFEYYLQHWNKGRPIIIAGHSQGSKFAEQLLKDYFEGKPLQSKLVVAYIPGWSVPKEYFTSLKTCSDSLQTGCICSWRTLRNNYVPSFLEFEKGNSLVTNPLTWTISDQLASRKLNKGSVLIKYNKIYKRTTNGRISKGFLYVKKPKFPWSFLYLSRNYHVGDINLFYMNIRENIRQRITAFKNN
jgi:hypothetical protein